MSDTIQYDGRVYRWDGRTWADVRTGQIPPLVLTRRLDALGHHLIAAGDARLTRVGDKITAACQARDVGQMARAERLVREVLEKQPHNPVAIAVLCSILRLQGQAEAALEATLAAGASPAILTSRAAALCYLGRWDEAARLIEEAQTIGALPRAGPMRRRLDRFRARAC